MPHRVEEKGVEFLISFFKSRNIKVRRLRKGPFDIIVESKLAEVKTKNKEFGKLDFISLTNNQFLAAKKKSFDIYIISGLSSTQPEIYKISSKDLLKNKPRIVTSYEYDRRYLIEAKRLI